MQSRSGLESRRLAGQPAKVRTGLHNQHAVAVAVEAVVVFDGVVVGTARMKSRPAKAVTGAAGWSGTDGSW